MNKLGYYCAILAAALSPSFAHADISLDTLKAEFPNFGWNELANGEIVSHVLPEQEANDAALAVIIGVKVNAPMEEVIRQLQVTDPEVKSITIDANNRESIAKSLEKFSLPTTQQVGFDWFLNPKADGTFNVNAAELKVLQTTAQDVKKTEKSPSLQSEAMAKAVKQLLAARVVEYREKGLKGISPYHVDGDDIRPGDYLADSLQHLDFLKKHSPDFYSAFANYPNADYSAYEQEFFIVTELEEGRPVTSLKHWMIELGNESTLIGERQFYISHSLDAMHTLILATRAEESTYLFMLNLSFTQKVAGMGSFVAHKVGRNKVKSKIEPLFEKVQAHYAN